MYLQTVIIITRRTISAVGRITTAATGASESERPGEVHVHSSNICRCSYCQIRKLGEHCGTSVSEATWYVSPPTKNEQSPPSMWLWFSAFRLQPWLYAHWCIASIFHCLNSTFNLLHWLHLCCRLASVSHVPPLLSYVCT